MDRNDQDHPLGPVVRFRLPRKNVALARNLRHGQKALKEGSQSTAHFEAE